MRAPGEPGRIRTFQGIGYLLDVEGLSDATANGDDATPGRDADVQLVGGAPHGTGPGPGAGA